MRSAARALQVEEDEVPVIQGETLEAHVIAIRTDVHDLKADFRAALARIDADIRAFAAKAESEIKALGARLEAELKEFRLDRRELRAEDKALRDRVDASYAVVIDKIDVSRKASDQRFEALLEKIDANRKASDQRFERVDGRLSELHTAVSNVKALQKAMLWVLSGLGTLAIVAVTVAKALNWI